VLRTAAAAGGAAANVLVSAAAVFAPAIGVPLALHDVLPVLVLASAAAVLQPGSPGRCGAAHGGQPAPAA
jgi:hypothetical protein